MANMGGTDNDLGHPGPGFLVYQAEPDIPEYPPGFFGQDKSLPESLRLSTRLVAPTVTVAALVKNRYTLSTALARLKF